MKKLGILTILSILFIMGSAFAVELTVSPEVNRVRQGETASYTFNVKGDDGVYLFSIPGPNTEWISLPSRVDVVGGSATFNVLITPPRNAMPNTYLFPITVYKGSDSATSTLEVIVKTKDGIVVESITPEFPNYRQDETITMKLALKSDEPLARDVDIIFDIKNPDGTHLRTTTLSVIVPQDSRVAYDQTFDLGTLAPGKYQVNVAVKRNTYVYHSTEGSFEVNPLVNIVKDKKNTWTFLAVKSVISVKNTGNSPTENVEVKDTLPLFWSYFVKEDGASTQSSGSDVLYTWRLASVDPATTKEVSYQIILWPIYLIVLGLAMMGFKGYTTFLTPSVSKSFSSKVNLGEGKEASVVIHAKNKGFRTLQNVTIDDTIPSSFKIVDASVPRPKYRKTTHGSELKWHLGTLAPGEERVFAYKIKNMMGIIGRVDLPSAHMRTGKSTFRSNRPSTSGDKRKQEI